MLLRARASTACCIMMHASTLHPSTQTCDLQAAAGSGKSTGTEHASMPTTANSQPQQQLAMPEPPTAAAPALANTALPAAEVAALPEAEPAVQPEAEAAANDVAQHALGSNPSDEQLHMQAPGAEQDEPADEPAAQPAHKKRGKGGRTSQQRKHALVAAMVPEHLAADVAELEDDLGENAPPAPALDQQAAAGAVASKGARRSGRRAALTAADNISNSAKRTAVQPAGPAATNKKRKGAGSLQQSAANAAAAAAKPPTDVSALDAQIAELQRMREKAASVFAPMGSSSDDEN
jgi:hypothetical protein